jgi:hypothetical protein
MGIGPDRISEAVEAAINWLARNGKVTDRERFIAMTNQKNPPVRNRENVGSSSLRKPELIAPAEIREALTRLVSDHLGARRDEVRTTVARILGFKSTSAQLKETLDRQIDVLLQNGQMSEREDKLFVGKRE